jgi:hypothetical protein
MSTTSSESPREESGRAEEETRKLTRFAQYTSPVMLAMLASAGKDMAAAQVSPPGPA